MEPAPSPAQGSQHSSQPPTPSAMTLVQPALCDLASPAPDFPNAALYEQKQWQEFGRPCGGVQQGSTPAMQSARPARQAASVYGEAFDELRRGRKLERAQQTSQRCCQPTHIASTSGRQHSAPGSLVRQDAPCSSASLNAGMPRLHDTGSQAPKSLDAQMSVSLQQAWPRTADAVSERRASGASASCSGRGQQHGPSHTRQTPSATNSAPGSLTAGPDSHQKPRPQTWFKLPGGSAAAQARPFQSEETPRSQGMVQQMPTSFGSRHMAPMQHQLQRHSGGGQPVRRGCLGLASEKDTAAAAAAAQQAALAEVHRRGSEFRTLLPRIPPPPSSYEK